MQRNILSVVHLYSKEYGWTREYILDNVFIDEHILMAEIIKDAQRNEYFMQAQITLLPHLEDKAREEFFDMLSNKDNELTVQDNQKTDFDAIKKAKEQLNSM